MAGSEKVNMSRERVDLIELKKRILMQLGNERGPLYWDTVKKFISAKLSKHEFETRLMALLQNNEIFAHNQFMAAVVGNAHSKEIPVDLKRFLPPPKKSKAKKSKDAANQRGRKRMLELAGARYTNSYLLGEDLDEISFPLPPYVVAHKSAVLDEPLVGLNSAQASHYSYHQSGPMKRARRRKCVDNLKEDRLRSLLTLCAPLHPAEVVRAGALPPLTSASLPDFNTLKQRMIRTAHDAGLNGVNDASVKMIEDAMKIHLKDIIQSCIEVVKPVRRGKTCNINEIGVEGDEDGDVVMANGSSVEIEGGSPDKEQPREHKADDKESTEEEKSVTAKGKDEKDEDQAEKDKAAAEKKKQRQLRIQKQRLVRNSATARLFYRDLVGRVASRDGHLESLEREVATLCASITQALPNERAQIEAEIVRLQKEKALFLRKPTSSPDCLPDGSWSMPPNYGACNPFLYPPSMGSFMSTQPFARPANADPRVPFMYPPMHINTNMIPMIPQLSMQQHQPTMVPPIPTNQRPVSDSPLVNPNLMYLPRPSPLNAGGHNLGMLPPPLQPGSMVPPLQNFGDGSMLGKVAAGAPSPIPAGMTPVVTIPQSNTCNNEVFVEKAKPDAVEDNKCEVVTRSPTAPAPKKRAAPDSSTEEQAKSKIKLESGMSTNHLGVAVATSGFVVKTEEDSLEPSISSAFSTPLVSKDKPEDEGFKQNMGAMEQVAVR